MELFWICPDCNNKISFTKQIENDLFDDEGDAWFSPEGGMTFHTIECNCGCEWHMNISPVSKSRKEYEKAL